MTQYLDDRQLGNTKRGALKAFLKIAASHRIFITWPRLSHELALGDRIPDTNDVLKAADITGLSARVISKPSKKRLTNLPTPALLKQVDGSWLVLNNRASLDLFRIYDPIAGKIVEASIDTAFSDSIQCAIIFIPRAKRDDVYNKDRLGWFKSVVKKQKSAISSIVFASLSIQILNLISPLAFQIVIDKALAHKSQSTLIAVALGLLIIGLFLLVLKQLRAYALYHASSRIDVELGSKLVRHLLSLPISYFESRATGNIVARIREIESVRAFLTGQSVTAVIDTFFAVIFFAVLFSYSSKITIILLAFVPAYLLVPFVIRPTLIRLVKAKFEHWSASQQFVVENLVSAASIKSAAVESTMASEWETRFALYVRTGFETLVLASASQNIVEFLTKCSTVVVLYFGAQEVLNGQMTIGALIAFNMIANQITQPILRISQAWQDYQQVKISVSHLGDILDQSPEPLPKDAFTPAKLEGEIEFRNVTFKYPGSANCALSNVSLHIHPGEHIGIVGASGSGKSTLIKLLQGFHSIDDGTLLIDRRDLCSLDRKWLRSHMGVVLQDDNLFHRSVFENICLGQDSLRISDVISAAELAGAHEFIQKMPARYETLIGERGVNLSGGQRQRLAIARALARNPQILIFDEATSALDYESESIVQANMANIVKGRTVITVAHRLSAVRQCDRIVGMADGKIVEIGTHYELLDVERGIYKSLWEIQYHK